MPPTRIGLHADSGLDEESDFLRKHYSCGKDVEDDGNINLSKLSVSEEVVSNIEKVMDYSKFLTATKNLFVQTGKSETKALDATGKWETKALDAMENGNTKLHLGIKYLNFILNKFRSSRKTY